VTQPCPPPCPTVCPEPCPPPCPPCPCPVSVPAAVGAGPASYLGGLECPCFDPAYAQRMYEQNSVIIAVTDFGAHRAPDKNLRRISREINDYLTSANAKLVCWFTAMCCGGLAADCPRAQAIIADLSAQDCACLDAVYARTLSELLRQSNCADELGGARAVTPQIRQQANFLAGKEANWAFRLDRWVTDHGCI
jgi:hypothetical protein